MASNSSTNGCSSGTNSSATSGSSSPVAPDLSPQQEPAPPKEDTKVKMEPGVRSKTETTTKGKMESTVKVRTEPEEEAKPSVSETRSTTVDTSSVELHPRKRKLKSKSEPSHTESDHLTSFGSAPHPHEVPVTNCYQMFMDIRRQVRFDEFLKLLELVIVGLFSSENVEITTSLLVYLHEIEKYYVEAVLMFLYFDPFS